MNASCIICSDVYTPKSEIYTTGCGHLFHHDCLTQWLERSRTCPQCRHKETSATIHRIYLNFASSEGIVEDAVLLQAKLDAVKFEISLKEKDIEKYSGKYKACKAKCTRMREAIVEMENEQRTHESSMLALQYQVKNYQDKVQDNNKLLAEIEQLKKQIEGMQHAKSLICDCDDQVNHMLSLNNDLESLGILSQTLKIQLEETKTKNKGMSTQIYRIGKEMIATNSTIDKFKTRNEEMNNNLVAHENCSSEIRYLHNKIKEKGVVTRSKNCTITSGENSGLESPIASPLLLTQPNFQCTSEPISLNDTSRPSSSQSTTTRIDKLPRTGLKRTKSTNSFTSSTKFRKLAPGNSKKPL